MSPINFDVLQDSYPDLADVWDALRSWFARHGRWQYVDLPLLLRGMPPHIDRVRLIVGLQGMIDQGMLATAYRVKAPNGELLEGDFDEPDQIPPELPSRDYSELIRTADGDIVSGYRWGPSDAA